MSTAALVRLYPKSWRAHYGEEYCALLDQRPLTAHDALDSMRGAWDAHVRGYREGTAILPLSSTAALVIFGAWIGFVVAGMELYAVVDDSPFVPAMRMHPPFALAWLTLEGSAALSLAAVVVGGTPIALGILRYAFMKRRSLLRLLAVPVAAATLCLGYAAWTAAIAYAWIPAPTIFGPITTAAPYDPHVPASRGNLIIAVCGLVLIVVSVTTSVAALIALVARSEVRAVRFHVAGATLTVEPYRFARLLAHLLACATGCAVIATTIWELCAWMYTPDAFAENGTAWIVITLVMATTHTVVTAAAWRGAAKHWPPAAVS